MGETGGEPLIQLENPEGKEAHVLLGSIDLGLKKRLDELEAIRCIEGSGGDVLQIDVVVILPGFIHLFQLAVPPSVGLGAQIFQLSSGLPEKSRHGVHTNGLIHF